METEKDNNSRYYNLSEKGIKKRNYKLWHKVNNLNFSVSFKEKFYLYENSLSKVPSCYCGGALKFIDMKSGFRKFCSKNCMYNSDDVKKSRKKTSLDKWGVDNPSKSTIIKKKVKKTNLKRFGVEYPLQSDDVKKKLKKYFLDKWGVDNPSKLKEVRKKAEITLLENWGVAHPMLSDEIKSKIKYNFINKWGVDNPFKLKEVREKAQSTMLEKWGVKHALQNKEILNKLKKTNLEKWGKESFTSTKKYQEIMKKHSHDANKSLVNTDRYTMVKSNNTEYEIECKICSSEFTIQRQLWRNRKRNSEEICLVCNPINTGVSKIEKDLLNFIKSSYDGEIVENFKLGKKEIDIYLPHLRIGFELNGLYWHSELHKEKKYHIKKTEWFLKNEISLIHIWEDEWLHKREIVESMILNKISKSSKIWARNCEVKEIIDNTLVRDFLERNHIQGFVGSKVKLGLFQNGELVSLMTFGNLRRSLGQSKSSGNWELLRFCNKLNYSVVGGASKLFKYFLDNFEFNQVISYSLNTYSNGNLYNKIGFKLSGETGVNYFWCKGGIRSHRFNFRKDKLVKQGADPSKTESEIMYSRDYFKVFDCGSKKWIYNR